VFSSSERVSFSSFAICSRKSSKKGGEFTIGVNEVTRGELFEANSFRLVVDCPVRCCEDGDETESGLDVWRTDLGVGEREEVFVLTSSEADSGEECEAEEWSAERDPACEPLLLLFRAFAILPLELLIGISEPTEPLSFNASRFFFGFGDDFRITGRALSAFVGIAGNSEGEEDSFVGLP
jgi:hypothetical protein